MTKSDDDRTFDRRGFLRRVICASAGATLAATRRVLTATPAAQATGEATQVAIDNFSFTPATVAVQAGTTVTWTNRDDVPHNVIGTDKKFASPVLDTDEKFSYTFENPGTYKYYCSIHPKMTGKVVVG